RSVPDARSVPGERTVPGKRTVPVKRTVPDERTVPFGTILGDAVKNSITAILTIGGFVVLFSIIIHILTKTNVINVLAEITSAVLSPFGIGKEITKGILSGLLEVTTGSSITGYALATPLFVKLPAASFIIGWAGLSVHLQVTSIVSKTDISIRPYLIGKFAQGILASAYTWLALKIFHGTFLLEGTVLSRGTLLPKDQFINPNSLYSLSNSIAGNPLQILVISVLLMLTTLALFIAISFTVKQNRAVKGRLEL
ncbi:MAG: hypothetical protein GXY17_11370, partial [Clostridiaceae bacterium]|nr:hypothetical protein [Clostridiaceae bacterium]